MARRKKKVTRAGNHVHRNVTLQSVMSSRAFLDGVADLRAGKPLAETDHKSQWSYERGRQFACIYTGPVKQGRYVIEAAVIAMSEAIKAKHIL